MLEYQFIQPMMLCWALNLHYVQFSVFLYISVSVKVFIFIYWNIHCLPQIFIRIWRNIFSDLQVFPLSSLEYSVFWNVWNLVSSGNSESKISKSIQVCLTRRNGEISCYFTTCVNALHHPYVFFSTSSGAYNFSDIINILNILFCSKKLLNSEFLHSSITGDNGNFCLICCF